MRRLTLILLLFILGSGPAFAEPAPLRPKARPVPDPIPVTQWDFRPEATEWSRAALAALRQHGKGLIEIAPGDIHTWCPGYARAQEPERRAFWVGFLSALAKYESTWRPDAVGGGGQWYGLLQILPGTARGYGCRARTGNELKDGAANLSCAIRIMSRTVRRDGVIHARSPRWSGVSADWGPMRSEEKRRNMADWLRRQDYCLPSVSPRPRARPASEKLAAGPARPEVRPLPRPQTVLARAETDAPAPPAAPATDG